MPRVLQGWRTEGMCIELVPTSALNVYQNLTLLSFLRWESLAYWDRP